MSISIVELIKKLKFTQIKIQEMWRRVTKKSQKKRNLDRREINLKRGDYVLIDRNTYVIKGGYQRTKLVYLKYLRTIKYIHCNAHEVDLSLIKKKHNTKLRMVAAIQGRETTRHKRKPRLHNELIRRLIEINILQVSIHIKVRNRWILRQLLGFHFWIRQLLE